MPAEYSHKDIEEKWLEAWESEKLFQNTTKDPKLSSKNKRYMLFAFAYPSGEGLHVGHVESKTALDIMVRHQRMNGLKPLFPVGWDAFGLPAENYAVKTGTHPSITTKRAIANFSKQIKRLGISYDWSTEIATSHPEYYKWTQWLFLQLYKKDLAFKKEANVNWCSSCQTVLANEQVINGTCERCGTEVIQKKMNQWFFRITDYKDELIEGLKEVDWPEATKQQQINWIGRSEGAEIDFKIVDAHDKSIDTLRVFTTRPDTIYGATYMVVAPEHELLNKVPSENVSDVWSYLKEAKSKTEEERLINKDKTGIFSGLYAINPVNKEKIPVWVSDYVLMGYGTGAIMSVPAHDDRDMAFAKKFDLPTIQVIDFEDKLVNSDKFNGMDFETSKVEIVKFLESIHVGKAAVTYKLRDWLISRQRYWGAPIPIVYDPQGNMHAVKEEHLPWILPDDVKFNPTGESPLITSKEFIKRTEKLYGKGWKPEFDTMDTFVDSSWYFLRYTDPRNTKEFAAKEQLEKLLPVDFYMIGPEHTVLHLLYSRFFTKFLRDEGYLKFGEPFLKMRHQGMILGPDHKKMSKSKGNVINPDEIIESVGADALRVYEMFMAPLEADKPWDTNSLMGISRFLARVYKLALDKNKSEASESTKNVLVSLHKTIKKVNEDIPVLKFNTAIAKMMEFINEWEKPNQSLIKEDVIKFIKVLAPFAPFISEELYQILSHGSSKVSENFISVHVQSWPEHDESLVVDEKVTIVVQVDGKVRATLENISKVAPQDEVKRMAIESLGNRIEAGKIISIFYVPARLINFVTK